MQALALPANKRRGHSLLLWPSVESVASATGRGDTEGDVTGCLAGGGAGEGACLSKVLDPEQGVSSEQGGGRIWLRTASTGMRSIPETVTKENCTLRSTGHTGSWQGFELC